MTLTYGGTDLSQYITRYGFVETPRVIDGPNAGTSIDGTAIPDVIAVKYDVTCTCRPLTLSQCDTLIGIVNTSLSDTYQDLVYTRANGTTRKIKARISLNSFSKIVETKSKTLFDGIVLTFKEK